MLLFVGSYLHFIAALLYFIFMFKGNKDSGSVTSIFTVSVDRPLIVANSATVLLNYKPDSKKT